MKRMKPAWRRGRGYFDDPIVETELPSKEPILKLEAPMVADHHAATVLYDAHERPVRRQIGFRLIRR